MRGQLLTMYSTSRASTTSAGGSENSSAMGEAFDKSKNDDYVLPAARSLRQPGLQARHEELRLADGKSIRFIVQHEGDPETPKASRTSMPSTGRQGSHQGHAVQGAKIYLAGTAATYKDMHDGSQYDLMIVGISALA